MVRTVPKKALLVLLAATAILMLLYYSRKDLRADRAGGDMRARRNNQHRAAVSQPRPAKATSVSRTDRNESSHDNLTSSPTSSRRSKARIPHAPSCPEPGLKRTTADIETVDVFPTLNFDVRLNGKNVSA